MPGLEFSEFLIKSVAARQRCRTRSYYGDLPSAEIELYPLYGDSARDGSLQQPAHIVLFE
jgi:hypothetical protein